MDVVVSYGKIETNGRWDKGKTERDQKTIADLMVKNISILILEYGYALMAAYGRQDPFHTRDHSTEDKSRPQKTQRCSSQKVHAFHK